MPKLFQINTVVRYTATGKIAEALGKKVLENGWESYIAHARTPKKSDSKTIIVGNRFDFYWHALMTRFFDLHGLMSKKATNRLISEIKSIDPDIIHLHNIHGYYLNFPRLFDFLEQYGKPVVWTLHDCWALTGHCTHYENVGCYKWQSTCHSCPQLGEYPKTFFLDRTKKNHQLKKVYFNKPDKLNIVTVSQWLQRQVRLSGLKQVESQVIYNGIDITKFRVEPNESFRNQNNPDGKFLILGVAGNWTKNKGLNDFIELRKLLDDNFMMVVIGLNEKQLKQIPPNIHGIQKTESIEELVNWYNLADVYFNASVEETFGMTTAEAMACGTPVIVYNATACPEIVTEEVGYIADKQNLDMVKSAIEKIQSVGKSRYSKECENYILENFAEQDQYQLYMDFYESLVKRNDA